MAPDRHPYQRSNRQYIPFDVPLESMCHTDP